MQSFMKTILSALQAWVNKRIKSNTPNWNESNPEADGYIKNKPFYDVITDKTIVSNVTLQTYDGEPAYNPFRLNKMIEGQIYTVIWDDVEYECEAYIAQGPNTPSLGNSVIGGAFGGGNGEPFFITIYYGDVMVFSADGEHTISISTSVEITKKLDVKYLPSEALAQSDFSQNDESERNYIKNRTHYYGEKIFNSTWMDNVTITGFSNAYKFLPVEEVALIPKLNEHKGWNYNSRYTVIWDGIEYSNLAVSGHSGSPSLSFGQNNDISIEFDGRMIIYCDNDYSSTSHIISVYEYTDSVTLTGTLCEPETTGGIDIDFHGKEFPPFFAGEIYHVEYTLCGQHIAYQVKAWGDGQLDPPNDEYYRIPTGTGSYAELCTIYGSNNSYLPNRVYLYSGKDLLDLQTTLEITIRRGTKPLDEVFIPKSIARVEQVPIIDATLSIEGAAADAKTVDNAINERIIKPKDYISFIDQVNGYTYLVSMRDGNLVSTIGAKSIEVTTMPTRTAYMNSAYFDPTGMVVTATCYDETTREIADYTYTSTALTEGTTSVKIFYTEAGVTYTADVPVTVSAFDPAVALIDFAYTDNGNGTYTITGWNGTYNGEVSTEIIIPNYECIIV